MERRQGIVIALIVSALFGASSLLMAATGVLVSQAVRWLTTGVWPALTVGGAWRWARLPQLDTG